jgi:hypothetical protein
MTLLVTVVRQDFVLSVADCRSSVQSGGSFVTRDDRFNKHVYFSLLDERNACFHGAATFTGVAEWRDSTGTVVSTDKVLAAALASAAAKRVGVAQTLHAVAVTLARERDYLRSQVPGPFPGFTVVVGGFLSSVREPLLSMVTDGQEVPSWDEDLTQIEVPAPPPFRIHIAVRCGPSLVVAGFAGALSPVFPARLNRILNAPAVRAYDLARYVVRGIREAARRTGCIGSRVSTIVLPAMGWVDTGLWQLSNEPLRALMPTTVFVNGTIWSAREVDLDFRDIIGELPRHDLLFEGMADSRVSRGAFRRAKRLRSAAHRAPTIYGIIGWGLWGKDPEGVGCTLAEGSAVDDGKRGP